MLLFNPSFNNKKITEGNLPHLEATETQLQKKKQILHFALSAYYGTFYWITLTNSKMSSHWSNETCTTKWRLAHAKYGDLWSLGGKL